MKSIVVLIILLTSVGKLSAQKIRIAEPVSFLALGDSYTIGQSVPSDESWPAQFARALAYRGYAIDKTKIIAQTGWRTDNLASAINSQQPLEGYNLVSLLIGVNNQFQGGTTQTYAAQFEALLQTAIALAGNSKENVFVLSIPDYAYTPFGAGNTNISAQIDLFNAVNKQITQNYGVPYIDITPISKYGLSRPELVAPDGLHPSGIMYGFWVEEILKNIKKELALNEQLAENNLVDFSIMQRDITVKSIDRDAEMFVYAANGAVLKQLKLRSNEQLSISLSGLPKGLYIILIRDKSIDIFKKKIILI